MIWNDMKRIRWYIEVSNKGIEDWIIRDDLTYSGWFHWSGDNEVTDSLQADFDTAVDNYPHLDIRLVQETHSLTKTIIRSEKRENDFPVNEKPADEKPVYKLNRSS